MSCYHPLHAYKGKSKDAQKVAITFRRSDSWRGVELDLPCGRCIGCRLERSRQWAVRCLHESSLYEDNCFVTLTYSDENLPKGGSLVLSDFQKFMKRLRKFVFPRKVRFYHCGEYGEKLSRPHYHALLFNYDFADKQFFSQRNGYKVYTSSDLSSLWEKGHAVIGAVTFESAAYVARYILKKVTGENAAGHYGDRVPEYTTMSRRPGLGKGWYDKFKGDVYPLDRVVVRGSECRPPRFYDDLLGREDPSALALVKIDRENNGNRFVLDVLSDGRVIREPDSSDRRLAVKEVCKLSEISTLRRHVEAV